MRRGACSVSRSSGSPPERESSCSPTLRRGYLSSLLVGSVVMASPVSIARPAGAAPRAPLNTASAANPYGAEQVGASPSAVVPMDHGSWTAHTYVLTDPSPSSYEVYGRTSASQAHDWAHAYVALWNVSAKPQHIVNEKVATCGQVSEGCIDTRTTGFAFSQGYYDKRLVYIGCAVDFGTHSLEGDLDYMPCREQGLFGAHYHVSNTFS
jgi:hypothetical protein